MSAPLLVVRGLTRWFGGLAAVQGVDIDVAQGEIVALIGPNGAGKTTVFNLLTGVLRPSAGEIVFDGRPIAGGSPESIAALGLVRTFQNLRLFRRMTVLENVLVASFCGSPGRLVSWLLPGHRRWLAERERQAATALDFVGLSAAAEEPAMRLSHGEQRRLEVARALGTRPRLLLLDEPCAGLTRAEVDALVQLIRRVRDEGVTVLLIEHDMDFVMALADRIVVLNFGRKIAEGPAAVVRDEPEVVKAYLGTETLDARP